ncbi:MULTISPECIES: DNA helicase RecQ [unclassified Facklamia]|uniref:DNA helicase RecQ n=1 Tax=Aerococcaceae TaxID=186827 RepID=UPI0013B6C3D4|nr:MULTISPECIES: DNA helicase RecQ [unclassified Facklamia]NEW64343.1 DNA helicase RecQ [Facklamia sp. 252]NEW67820.1 DNA helicase RecQ [Facklamia sp. 253]QQD64805.1 DNA helicase RecQ [Aerococcaceae bacterium zg-252]
MNAETALQHYFGYPKFRYNQAEIVQTILAKQDILAILPTGGGKSICYQLPAVLMNGLTLVISPLISLMKDQIDTLLLHNIPAATLHSGLSTEEYFEVMAQLRQGSIKLLYIAPERLMTDSILSVLNNTTISQIAIDEAHCVSQWGHDFRPSYVEIRQFIDRLEQRPVITAFTATATQKVQQDIILQLGLKQPKVVGNTFDRPNIKLTVLEPTDKMRTLVSYLSHDESIIIYAQTRKNVERIAEKLVQLGYKATKYHAGLSNQERHQAQEEFIYDKKNIIVATNAFGMGIDKTDVRKVIHYNLPTDLEGYYQEAGRAGRDGLAAEAILLFAKQDIVTAKFMIENGQDTNRLPRLETMIQYANQTTCLRQFILNYFGEASKPCQNCSSCLSEFDVQDITKEAQIILSTVARLKYAFGMTMVANVVKGSRDKKIVENNLNQLSTYGLMKEYSLGQIKDMISLLVANQYLAVTEHKGLMLTPLARQILLGEQQLTMKKQKTKVEKKLSNSMADSSEIDIALYNRLRDMRFTLAQQAQLPAYIIFSNRTLEDMARKMPTDYDSFLEVEGVGAVKAMKYSEQFIQVIQAYLANE